MSVNYGGTGGFSINYPSFILSFGSINSPNSLSNVFSQGWLAAEENNRFNTYYASTPQIYNSNLAQVIYL